MLKSKTEAKSKGRDRQLPYGRSTGVPNPIDIHVGKRIRIRRLLLGMNQETLGTELGQSFQ
jgi:hypothetical protein